MSAFRGKADIAGTRHILSIFGTKPLACCRALPLQAAPPYLARMASGYRPGFFMATGRLSPLDHHLDASRIEWTPTLVEMTSVFKARLIFRKLMRLPVLGLAREWKIK